MPRDEWDSTYSDIQHEIHTRKKPNLIDRLIFFLMKRYPSGDIRPGCSARVFQALIFFLVVIALFSVIIFTSSKLLDSVAPVSLRWKQATSEAAFSARRGQASLVFNDQIWVMAGWDGTSTKNDVWSSTDGISWSLATASAAWSKRNTPVCLVFDSKMWLLGGYTNDSNKYNNDVWNSADGINWIQVTPSAPWSGRSNHSGLIFDNKMWIMGGYNFYKFSNDVWCSTDGLNWTEVASSAPWPARTGTQCLVFDNKMWVIGGSGSNSNYSDAWYSTDGKDWTAVTTEAPWGSRTAHSCLIYGKSLLLIGGYQSVTTADLTYKNDVWSTSDGITWTKIAAVAVFPGRFYHSSLVYKSKLWVIGGGDGTGVKNDVWSCRPSRF